MNTKRIEEIQKETAYPDSISVQQALLKVWNECEQGKEELQKCKDSPVYFYNKYVRREGQKELTEAEVDAMIKHYNQNSKS